MLPFIDAINHDPVKGGILTWNANGDFEIRSTCAYRAGEEVYLCYGPPDSMGNDALQATYGFQIPGLD